MAICCAELPKDVQQLGSQGTFRHELRFDHRRLDVERLVRQQARQQPFGVQQSNDVIHIAVADRQARKFTRFYFSPNLGFRVVQIDPVDFGARRHDRPGVAVAQAEDAGHHLLLAFVEHPGLDALLHHGLDFFLGDGRILGFAHAQQEQHQIGRGAQKPGQRRGQLRQRLHGARYQRSDVLRRTERQPLGHQFAQNQREIGRYRHHQAKAQGIGVTTERCRPQ